MEHLLTRILSQDKAQVLPVVYPPYGAEVTYAEFNLIGESSTTQYSNHTTNSHWGGKVSQTHGPVAQHHHSLAGKEMA